jgi:two-component system alkaline phosphatase synthesis response regulator PhoP
VSAKILVVEDEPAIALGLKNDLTLEGYFPEVAADGDTAVQRASEVPFDLILLDVMLPKKDGFAVCRDLRRSGVTTPIIMLTARTQESDKLLGLGLGADDYVTKPFSPLELCARIKAVLRRTAHTQSERYRFGSVDVDFSRGVVRRRGQPVDLTALELKVLGALVRARGHLLTREQVIDAEWGRGVAISDRVVDNHVMNLRRKLEDDPTAPRYLISLRGLGYRFENPDDEQTKS